MPQISSPTPDATTVAKGKIQLAGALQGTATSPSLSSAGIISVLQVMMPIGFIYMNKVNSTNPATLLGFGTWVAMEGRTIVGKAASGTFGTAGATMGAETHTLTIAEMPAHNHNLYYAATGGTGGGGAIIGPGGLPAGETTQNSGGGGAHNNIQPSVVAYMWERTA